MRADLFLLFLLHRKHRPSRFTLFSFFQELAFTKDKVCPGLQDIVLEGAVFHQSSERSRRGVQAHFKAVGNVFISILDSGYQHLALTHAIIKKGKEVTTHHEIHRCQINLTEGAGHRHIASIRRHGGIDQMERDVAGGIGQVRREKGGGRRE
jgi:hypothetical protein